MNETVLAMRAVTSEYARQLLWPFFWAGIAAYSVIMLLIGWIASISSQWWWLLGIGPTALLMLAFAAWLFIYMLAKRWSPVLTKRQKAATKKFVRHISVVAEQMAMPRFVIMMRVIKDVLSRPTNGKTFIGEIAQEPGEMRRDFDELKGTFR